MFVEPAPSVVAAWRGFVWRNALDGGVYVVTRVGITDDRGQFAKARVYVFVVINDRYYGFPVRYLIVIIR